eukprot:TRINITY_DN4630_c4_g1_i1.p1 TRINITY_DN4630_c4_g1~~TRINITY_DN4630_c4_g1_i1.p1  ORF type:complete len:1001 (+),score=255.61 TRINITY_DN4630_c4_g1_i1:101-3103(+)
MATAAQALDASGVAVYHCTTEAEMDARLSEHVLGRGCKEVGLDYRTKRTKTRDGRRICIAAILLSVPRACLVLQLSKMGPFGSWHPSEQGTFSQVMCNAELRKAGVNVLRLITLFREWGIECKGIYDLVPMAKRVKDQAKFKDVSKYDAALPSGSPKEETVILHAIADEPVRTYVKSPRDLVEADWEETVSAEAVNHAAYETFITHKVYTYLSRAEQELQASRGPTPVYVTNLPLDVADAELYAHFKCTAKRYPYVHKSMKNRSTANATLLYAERQEALDAIASYTHTTFRGRELVIAEDEEGLRQADAAQQEERAGLQVYLSNLPYFTTEAQIRKHFQGDPEMCGHLGLPDLSSHIKEARFFCHQDLGVGSVYFDSKKAARQAVEHYSGTRFTYGIKDAVTGEVKAQRRTIHADLDLRLLVVRQKSQDRGKGSDDYDPLDPYFSRQQRPGRAAVQRQQSRQAAAAAATPPLASPAHQNNSPPRAGRVVRFGPEQADDGSEGDDGANGGVVQWLAGLQAGRGVSHYTAPESVGGAKGVPSRPPQPEPPSPPLRPAARGALQPQGAPVAASASRPANPYAAVPAAAPAAPAVPPPVPAGVASPYPVPVGRGRGLLALSPGAHHLQQQQQQQQLQQQQQVQQQQLQQFQQTALPQRPLPQATLLSGAAAAAGIPAAQALAPAPTPMAPPFQLLPGAVLPTGMAAAFPAQVAAPVLPAPSAAALQQRQLQQTQLELAQQLLASQAMQQQQLARRQQEQLQLQQLQQLRLAQGATISRSPPQTQQLPTAEPLLPADQRAAHMKAAAAAFATAPGVGTSGKGAKPAPATANKPRTLGKPRSATKGGAVKDPVVTAFPGLGMTMGPEADPCTLHVGNIAWPCPEPELAQAFDQAGAGGIVETSIQPIAPCRDKAQGTGYAMVKFASPHLAQLAFRKMNGAIFRDRTLRVEMHRADMPRPKEVFGKLGSAGGLQVERPEPVQVVMTRQDGTRVTPEELTSTSGPAAT